MDRRIQEALVPVGNLGWDSALLVVLPAALAAEIHPVRQVEGSESLEESHRAVGRAYHLGGLEEGCH